MDFIDHFLLLLFDLGGDAGAATTTGGGVGAFFFHLFFVLGGDGGGVGATTTAAAAGTLFEVLLLFAKGFEKLNLDVVGGVDNDATAVDAGLLTGGLVVLLLLVVAVLSPPLPKLNFIVLVVDIVIVDW